MVNGVNDRVEGGKRYDHLHDRLSSIPYAPSNLHLLLQLQENKNSKQQRFRNIIVNYNDRIGLKTARI